MCDEDDDIPEPIDGSRFYIIHGMIHDRKTGRHVTTAPDEDIFMGMTVTETCQLLNNLADQPGIEDYKKWAEQNAHHVKRLDIALNGEAGAAQAPLIIDILSQVEDLRRKNGGQPLLLAPPFKQAHVTIVGGEVTGVFFDKVAAKRDTGERAGTGIITVGVKG